jgi:hypothetical protein
MSLLKDVISEMAAAGATSAGAIAGFRSPIGGKTRKKQRKKEDKVRSRLAPVGYLFRMVEAEQSFDPAAVVSKMAAADKKAKNMEDTKTFGLEDENGQVVRVLVAADEADDFETALAHMLHGEDDEALTDDKTSMEIAEVLFKLKDRFTIVDVIWPEIEEDEEEDATEASDETLDDTEGEDDLDADEEGEGEDDLDMEADDEGGEEFDQATMLSQVIDLLKSQQDAQAAESRAKEAEAEAKKAEAEREAAMAKVRQEEQILDMETYYKNKKDENKEAKRLAQLAKWKHDMAADEDDLGPSADPVAAADMAVGVEQEEKGTVNVFNKVDKNSDSKMDPQDFLRYLFKYLGDR